MKEKISLLVFSRNDIDKALSLTDHFYDLVDEILIFDSSSSTVHSRLLKEKEKRKLDRLRVFYVIAFGYPDPFRMYALSKCRNRWVLMVDTDERLSNSLKRDLHDIVSKTTNSAFAIKRYEDVSGTHRGAYSNWQIRLFRKDRTVFKGLIHEEPIINGTTGRLDSQLYYMDHVSELKGGASREYTKTEKFMRMSYASFTEVMLEYLYKFSIPTKRKKGGIGRFMLGGYRRIKGKQEHEELSDFDYATFFALRTFMTSIKSRKPSVLLQIVPESRRLTKLIRKWKSEPDSKEIFELSKILQRIGIIKFLGLDKESTVLALNKKYRSKKQGAELLISLLKEKYEKEFIR